MSSGTLPAVIVVGYNRPDSLRRLLASIGGASYPRDDVPLVISLDRSPVTEELMNIANSFQWDYGPKVIRSFPSRQGLRHHILQCGDLVEEYGAVIVLEDDVTVAPGYYVFALDALDTYAGDLRVSGISLYSHQVNEFARRRFTPVHDGGDVFFGQFSCSWGQCWSRSQWKEFKTWYDSRVSRLEMSGGVPSAVTRWPETSWAKYFVHYMVEMERYYAIPRVSYSTNNGDAGQHNDVASNVYQVPLEFGYPRTRFVPFDSGVKYDAHFGRVGMQEILALDLPSGRFVVDLFGTRECLDGVRFLVSTKVLPFRIVDSYGLRLRPMEMNVLLGVRGDAIRLYDVQNSAPRVKFRSDVSLSRIGYEHRTLSWREALRFGANGLAQSGVDRASGWLPRPLRRSLVTGIDSILESILMRNG